MVKESEEARDERKRRFIAALREKKCRDLIEPLARKIDSYVKGEITPEDVFKTVKYVARESDEIAGTFKKRPDVILAGIAMEENKYVTEISEINIKARQGDLTAVFTDAVINPANAKGVMSAGVAGAIKNAGGEGIEKEVVSKAPIPVGGAIATGAGSLPNLYVIHAVTVDEPSGSSSPENVKNALAAALKTAEEIECESLAIPGMGTGAGTVAPKESANAIVDAIKSHAAEHLSDIILIDRNDEMVEAFVTALERYDEENE